MTRTVEHQNGLLWGLMTGPLKLWAVCLFSFLSRDKEL